MGLLLYRDAGAATYVAYLPNTDPNKTYIETTHDCELGETKQTQVFLRNDDENYYYTNVSINSEALTPFNDTIGTETGWGIKLSAGSTQPTEAQWAAIDYGNKISMSDIGSASGANTTTYQSFWVRIECPAGIMPTTKESVSIDVNYTETAV